MNSKYIRLIILNISRFIPSIIVMAVVIIKLMDLFDEFNYVTSINFCSTFHRFVADNNQGLFHDKKTKSFSLFCSQDVSYWRPGRHELCFSLQWSESSNLRNYLPPTGLKYVINCNTLFCISLTNGLLFLIENNSDRFLVYEVKLY